MTPKSKRTGSHLKIENFGTEMQGVELFGDSSRPEPTCFRVIFPGGEIVVTRCTNGEYWAHTHIHQANQSDGKRSDGRKLGHIVGSRIDLENGCPQLSPETMSHETAHLAIKISTQKPKAEES